MRRREFIAALGGAAAWPLVARAQQSGKIPKIGVLWHAGNEQEEASFLGALRKGLNDLGYRATTTIPVVVAYAAENLVQDLAHPGGNLTGLSAMLSDLAGKQLEILKSSIPNCSAVALLWNANTRFSQYRSRAQEGADALRVSLHVVEVRSPDELEQAFSTIGNAHVDAVLLHPDSLILVQGSRIAQLALAKGLPTIAWIGNMADAGALLSYGADGPDLFRRAATYVDKILKGANPADLPVEQPTKFEFIINLKTAKALNLTIPPYVLATANKVIE